MRVQGLFGATMSPRDPSSAGAGMTNYVEIVLRRNRGWPWPEDSWGLAPMYGEGGWCHTCGVPKRSQTGSVVLQRKGLKIEGAWVPNWQFDVYCAAQPLADAAQEQFKTDLRPVAAVGRSSLDASQVVIESSTDPWFTPVDLDRLIRPIHGDSSETCTECGATRWMPVGMDVLPAPPASTCETATRSSQSGMVRRGNTGFPPNPVATRPCRVPPGEQPKGLQDPGAELVTSRLVGAFAFVVIMAAIFAMPTVCLRPRPRAPIRPMPSPTTTP